MTHIEIKSWKVFCIEENIFIYDIWSPSPPIFCPNNHTDRNLDHSKTRCSNTISNQKMQIEDATPGNYQVGTIYMEIPSGNIGDITILTKLFPMEIYLWQTDFCASIANKGDSFDIIINPDNIIGILLEDKFIGNKILKVSASVFQFPYLSKGIYISLDDGINYQNVGRILSINKEEFTITVENELEYNFNINTLIKVNIYMIVDYIIDRAEILTTFGNKGIRTSMLPANTPVKIIYKNNTIDAKSICFHLEYNYE
jgi:hypothetical protein